MNKTVYIARQAIELMESRDDGKLKEGIALLEEDDKAKASITNRYMPFIKGRVHSMRIKKNLL